MRFPTKAVMTTLGLLAGIPSASAGDFARVQVLGFSGDGAYFAFEQYGIQDGSGFPYSEIYVLDTVKDSWVKPSPFRKQDEIDDSSGYDEDAVLTEARAANRALAQSLLSSKKIAGKGMTVGRNPPTELNAEPHRMVVNPRLVVPPIDDPVELRLTEKGLPSSECASYGVGDTQGFRLTLTYQGQIRVLNNDQNLPKSRGCPLRYRIERFVTHYPANSGPVFAALILMETHGFEGPDGRYLAITGKL